VSFVAELKRRNVFRVAAAYIIVAWLIMQAGDTLAPALRLPDWINSALAFFLILGFPLALFFAWAFEMTPDGVKREKDVDRSQSITHVTGQKLNYTIIALLLVALGYMAWDKFIQQGSESLSRQSTEHIAKAGEDVTPTPDQAQSIAVLPFVDMSAGGDNAYFSDGLTEELLNMLAKISELKVAGRTSSFAFKGKDEDLRSIGEKLNVTSILEGSVRKDDTRNRVRITAQLINANDGYHLWSETYDRDLGDIFAIQEEIAREVAEALRVTLLGEDVERLESVASTQISTYELYLQGRQDINNGGYEALNRAVNKFQQALAVDPGYTPARLGLVNAWVELANTGAISVKEAVTRGVPMLETIMDNPAGGSEPHILMARLKALQHDPDAADKQFIQALELDPRNATALQEYGRFLFNQGRTEQGVKLIESALEIEPYATPVLWDYCQTNAYRQHLELALHACARIREIAPDSPLGWYGRGLAYLHTGDIARGLKGYADAIQRDPDDYEMLAAMANFWIELDDLEQASQWLARAEAIGVGQPVPIWARLNYYQAHEQHKLARELAGQALAQQMDNRFGTRSFFRQVWAFEATRTGDVEAALEPYREAFPWAFEAELTPPPGHLPGNDLAEIVALLSRSDPLSGRSMELLELAIGTFVHIPPEAGLWMGDIAYAAEAVIRGANATALARLDDAWNKHWRRGWRAILLYDPIFMPLRREPGYQQLVARFNADMERQRVVAYELMGITQ